MGSRVWCGHPHEGGSIGGVATRPILEVFNETHSKTKSRFDLLRTLHQNNHRFLSVWETEVAIRKQVTKGLLDRFAVEIDVSKAEFEQKRNFEK